MFKVHQTSGRAAGMEGKVQQLQGEGMDFFPTFKRWTQIQEEGKNTPPLQLILSPCFWYKKSKQDVLNHLELGRGQHFWAKRSEDKHSSNCWPQVIPFRSFPPINVNYRGEKYYTKQFAHDEAAGGIIEYLANLQPKVMGSFEIVSYKDQSSIRALLKIMST